MIVPPKDDDPVPIDVNYNCPEHQNRPQSSLNAI